MTVPAAVVRGVAAAAFCWLSFAAMTVAAVWNEARPGVAIADPVLALVAYVDWMYRWNYWIWVVPYLCGIGAILLLRAGDRVIICSDGLSDYVDDDAIADVLRSTTDSAEAGAQLVKLAHVAGAPDNVTAVIADVIED